jgi:hypothetical protein
MSKHIEYIESVTQAERFLERIQQFGDPIAAFDLSPDLDPESVPIRLLFCPECPVVYYLTGTEHCPLRCECGVDYFVEMVHIELVVQDNTVVYRKE